MTLDWAGVDAGEAAGGAARVGGDAASPAVGAVCAAEAVDTAEATDAWELRCRVGAVRVGRAVETKRWQGDGRSGTLLLGLITGHLEDWCGLYGCRCSRLVGHFGVHGLRLVGITGQESDAHLVVLLAAGSSERYGLCQSHGHGCGCWCC